MNDEEQVLTITQVKDLEVMSIDALVDYIGLLKSEIKRAEDEIETKKIARLGANSVFKS